MVFLHLTIFNLIIINYLEDKEKIKIAEEKIREDLKNKAVDGILR